MNKMLKLIHKWENRNTILLFDPANIPSGAIESVANLLEVAVLPVFNLPEKVKLIDKDTYKEPHDQR